MYNYGGKRHFQIANLMAESLAKPRGFLYYSPHCTALFQGCMRMYARPIPFGVKKSRCTKENVLRPFLFSCLQHTLF
jgi:hypothetical protein